MANHNDDLWDWEQAPNPTTGDEPTIQLQRIAKRRPERTRTHGVVAHSADGTADGQRGTSRSEHPAANSRRRSFQLGGGGRRQRPAADHRDGRGGDRRDDRAGTRSHDPFGDFDDLRGLTAGVPQFSGPDDPYGDFGDAGVTGGHPRTASADDLFDDYRATGTHRAISFADPSFDDGSYRDSRYVAGDDQFGPRAGAITGSISALAGAAGTRTPRHDEFDAGYDDDHTAEGIWLEPTRTGGRLFGSLDPRLLSVGAIALASVLAVPLIGTLTDGDGSAEMRSVTESVATTTIAPAQTTVAPVVIGGDNTPAAAPSDTAADEAGAPAEGAASVDGQPTEAVASASSSGGAATAGPSPADYGSSGLPAPSQRVSGHCGNPYEVRAGDFWARLASATGMSLDEFVAYNNATADTVLHPGDVVCLPLGTSIAVPTTAAPAPEPSSAGSSENDSQAAPSTSTNGGNSAADQQPSTTAAAATSNDRDDDDRDEAPSTDAPPTTTTAPSPPRSNASRSEVEQMIRDVWPDELEERALTIARRESNFRPNVSSPSGCCHGVFQLHRSHLSWAGQYGVTSVDQLFDARTNIELAYALYQRSGGWGPWAQTNY